MSVLDEVFKVRTPQTVLPVLNSIKKRFSPRIFSTEPIPQADLDIIFEAARLAPSGRNHQPWYFYYARIGTPGYEKLFTSIPQKNYWAKTAPIIILACYNPTEPQNTTNRWAQYDLGAAVMSLVLQASELNYSCRQIGSFDWEKTKNIFSVPDPFRVFTLIALGKIGTETDYRKADPEIIRKETTPNPKKLKILEYLSL